MLAFFDQPHGDTRHRRRHRHAGVHQRERTAANVAMDVEPFDSRISETIRIVYGNPSSAGKHRHQRALGKIAVADFTPSRTAQELDLADAERRKIIVQHEFFEVLADQRVDALFIRSRPQRGHDQRLGFTAGKKRRTMGARQDLHLAGNRPDILQPASIDAPFFLNHQTAKNVSLQLFESALDVFLLLRKLPSACGTTSLFTSAIRL